MEMQEWLNRVSTTSPDASGDGRASAEPVKDELLAMLNDAEQFVADSFVDSPELLPIRVNKSIAARMLQCEAYALEDHDGESWPQLRGSLLDVFIAMASGGHVPGHNSDPRDAQSSELEEVRSDLSDALVARGNFRDVERLAELHDDQLVDLVELGLQAAGVAVNPAWSPRTEVSQLAIIGGGALELTGRMDLVLGGPGTDSPAVCVEVKSGTAIGAHRAELHFYSLLWALRCGEEPNAMALWYPGSQVVPVEVPGAAMAAAHQVIDVVERLVAVFAGDEPRRRGGPQCSWCPLAVDCDMARIHLERGDDEI